MPHYLFLYFFFFNDTATTEIYTLSLHDALPISDRVAGGLRRDGVLPVAGVLRLLLYAPRDDVGARATARRGAGSDRKSTRLNSSHSQISYAVFCLKKKNNNHSGLRHPVYV